MRVLFVLQNAWRRGAVEGERDWNDRVWNRLLWRSQTGKRLREMIPDGIEYQVCNASPFVGNHSASAFPADPQHVLTQVRVYKPHLVVLLGSVAQEVRPHLPSRLGVLTGPHPAWRLLSKDETSRIRAAVKDYCANGSKARAAS